MRKASYNDFISIFFGDTAKQYSDRVLMSYYERYIASAESLQRFVQTVELPTAAVAA